MSKGTVVAGERYQATVPDTLDLATRAALAINALTRTTDSTHNYESYQCANFNVRPPYMNHSWGGPCLQKPAEALPMMRVMSGSEQNLEVDRAMVEGLLSDIDDDGLWWLKTEGRPWRAETFKEDNVFVCAHARLMLALLAWYAVDGDSKWLETVQRMADGLGKLAVHHDGIAFYPDEQYYRSGWKNVDASRPESGWGGRWTIADGVAIRALSRWYATSGDEASLDLARKLVKGALKPANWVPTQEPKMIVSAEHAHWRGHFHATTMRVMGLLEYALATNDARMKRFVRDFYEYGRNFGISRLGFVPAVGGDHGSYVDRPQVNEGCATADMIWLAVGLCDSGVGDYWEDIDQAVRNHLVENQLLRADLLEEISAAGPEHVIDPRTMTDDDVIARNIGSFSAGADPTMLFPMWTMCCVGNCSVALYRGWESILRHNEGVVQVNLLLNRASPWLDVDSYLPYNGKVVLKNKKAGRVHVRVPLWADKGATRSRINGKGVPPAWLNNYLVFGGLSANDVITVEFPMVETTEQHTEPTYQTTFTCQMRGNTLVDISPRRETPSWETVGQDDGVTSVLSKGYPIYEREHLKGDEAPMREVTRYVSPEVI